MAIAASLPGSAAMPEWPSVVQPAEGVFEIRDFTTASPFERLVHSLVLAIKRWTASRERQHIEDSTLGNFEIEFHCDPEGHADAPARLGVHSFPSRAHRFQRWFLIKHFIILSPLDRDLEPNLSRWLLSALTLAVRAAPPQLALNCFVPVGNPRRWQFIGEGFHDGRTLFATDVSTVGPQHLDDLVTLFQRKVQLSCNPRVAVRFTYIADLFDTAHLPFAEDPVESLQLHCLWPEFPSCSFQDNAEYSELEPWNAPFWKIRTVTKSCKEPLTTRLRSLLALRSEASASLRAAPTESLQNVIQECLESVLVPGPGQLSELASNIAKAPETFSQQLHEFEVRLERPATASIGLTLSPQLQVRAVVPGSLAHACDRVCVDDFVVAVNGEVVRTQAEFRTASAGVTDLRLTLRRTAGGIRDPADRALVELPAVLEGELEGALDRLARGLLELSVQELAAPRIRQGRPRHLRLLRDRALAAAEDCLEALSDFEAACLLSDSLRLKLGGCADLEDLVEALCTEGEAGLNSQEHRNAVEQLLATCQAIAKSQGHDVQRLFERPAAREFLLRSEAASGGPTDCQGPQATHRMYAELREGHVRLAFATTQRLV